MLTVRSFGAAANNCSPSSCSPATRSLLLTSSSPSSTPCRLHLLAGTPRMMLRGCGGPAVALTEYEDSILFDLDDPDFSSGAPELRGAMDSDSGLHHPLSLGGRRGSRGSSCGFESGSLVTLELPGTRERRLSGCSSCASFDGDLAYLSIESLRSHLHSCFTCGVSWVEDHVSLDCPECGGYSLERPCPACDGRCKATWKRDLASSHASGKAHWEGCCTRTSPPPSPSAAKLLLRKFVRLNLNKSNKNHDSESRLDSQGASAASSS